MRSESKCAAKNLKPSQSDSGHKALENVQKRFAGAVMRKLDANWEMQKTWTDGRDMNEVTAEFIKPNDRLTSFERIELYNKQYWFRLIDIMFEDYPGLCAVLGQKRFTAFVQEYLDKYPSRSGLLRNLGKHIEQFVVERPDLTGKDLEVAKQMAAFEWAQVVAFDEASKKPLTPDDLLGKDPAHLHMGVQPYITFLKMDWAMDKLLSAVKRQVLRGEASNATDGFSHGTKRKRKPKPEKVYMAVHRLNNSVYLKRLDAEGFTVLCALRDGASVADAISIAIDKHPRSKLDWAAQSKKSFQNWMELGWFCRP